MTPEELEAENQRLRELLEDIRRRLLKLYSEAAFTYGLVEGALSTLALLHPKDTDAP